MRTDAALELLKRNPAAFILAYIIAYRGQFKGGFNRYDLKLGESLIGDYQQYGLTRQKYRTAMRQLSEWDFATFAVTNRGTIGKLTDTRLFAITRLETNQPNNQRVTISQPSGNHRVTTTKNTRTQDQEDPKNEGLRGLKQQTAEELIQSLKNNLAYAGIDVDRELGKMQAWCKANRKEPTYRRFVNWLNRADRPLNSTSNRPKPDDQF
jgi:hypothetical protein